MLPREERYIYEWETRRGKGKWTYVFLTAFIWGSLVSVITKCFGLAFQGRLSLRTVGNTIFTVDFFPVWLKFVGGFFLFALLMWHLARRKYRELKQKQQSRERLRVPQ